MARFNDMFLEREEDSIIINRTESRCTCDSSFIPPADVARFNDMFLEREEDAVIRLRSLEDDAMASATAADLKEVYR